MKSTYLRTGDVIRTNPFKDFWIASVVMATQEKTDYVRSAALIGETNAVFRHAFTFEEIDRIDWRLARAVGGVHADMPVLTVYYSLLKPGVVVIGHIDPIDIDGRRYVLEFGPGNPPDWPAQGALVPSIGMSGLHAWRKAHDFEEWTKDLDEAQESHRALVERLKEQSMQKRGKKRTRRYRQPR